MVMVLCQLLLILGCSASLLGDVYQPDRIANRNTSLTKGRSSCHDEQRAVSRNKFHLKKKNKNSKFACVQLDFSDITTVQTSSESETAEGVGPDYSTRIPGIPSNISDATYNPQSKTIRVPPGIYSIRSCDIVDLISIDGNISTNEESISLSIGYITFYYSLDRGKNWNKIVAGSSATVEFLDSNFSLNESPYTFKIRFPPVEALATVKNGESITFAYSLQPVKQMSTTVLRNFSGRFIIEQITTIRLE